MIQVNSLAKGFGSQILFENVGFSLGKGERVGLVGRNGSGKTTLFKILLGEELSDSGTIFFPKNYQIASLKQHLSFSFSTILEEGISALPEEHKLDHYKVEKMLMGLGFKLEDMNKSPQDFSGGYQIRLNLAKVLLSEPDCLLLDEPTNYLDIVSMRWLSRFLTSFRGEIILITHDRSFMDAVSTHTMGIWRGKLFKIAGNTEKYFEQIILDEEQQEKTRVNNDKKRKDLEEFINRFKAKASKAVQAQSRMKLLEKMPELEALNVIQSLDFEFNYKECPGKTLMEVNNLGFDYGLGFLFQNLSFIVNRGEKIGIIGKNGKGKSTLLNVLANELTPSCGSISKNVNLLIGHFGQTNINRLHFKNTIEEEIASVDTSLTRERVRAICGTMMFSGDLAQKKIEVLSGGERARVLLGKLLARPTNLLLLDEPTNHLDQDSIESLAIELKNYPGAVIIVTHSENLLNEVADSLIVFHKDKAEYIKENYQGFLSKIGWEEESAGVTSPKVSSGANRQEIKRLRSEAIIQRSREVAPLKKRIEKLEESIFKWEEEEKILEKSLINLASAPGNSIRIQEDSLKLGVIKKSIDKAFEDLTEVTTIHDEIWNKWEEKLKNLEIP